MGTEEKIEYGRMYEVRLSLGDIMPKLNGRHKVWTLRFDERGAYLHRLYKSRTRAEVVRKLIAWYRATRNNLKYRNVGNSFFRGLPYSVDAVLEVKDDYGEVVFNPNMRSNLPKNRLLTPDKVDEIVKLGNGKFVKNTKYKKQGSFVLTDEYMKMDRNRNFKSTFLKKIPDVPYLYKHKIDMSYYAGIRIGRDSIDLSLPTKKVDVTYYTRSGKEISFTATEGKRIRAKTKFMKLNSHSLESAIVEAKKLKNKYKKWDIEKLQN